MVLANIPVSIGNDPSIIAELKMRYFVEIAVNVPGVTGSFHYHLPAELSGKVEIGHLVVVPFGKQKVHGVVLRFIDAPEVPETKAVLELVDPEAVLTAAQIRFAYFLADEYLSPVSSCIGLMLPGGLLQQADVLYTALGEAQEGLTEAQRRLWNMLDQHGSMLGAQLDRKLKRKYKNWRNSARSLARRGLISTQSKLSPPKVRPKRVRTAQLACSPRAAVEAFPGLGQRSSKAQKRRQSMLEFLIEEPGPVNVSWVYAHSGGSLNDLRVLNELGLVALGENEIWRDPIDRYDFVPDQPPPLTSDQNAVWKRIQDSLRGARTARENKPLLLHGVTGSGKTEIYLRAVEETLNLGRGAIVLVPEISLTPQTVRRFISRFPGLVGLIHSQLSAGERYDTWRRARAGHVRVIIGPRSALFAPLPDPGIIILDESHDGSYYQSDPAPRYHARHAAAAYAKMCAAVCLMGSATPDVTSVYHCQRGRWEYLRLPSRILAHKKAVQSQLARLGTTKSRFTALESQADAADLPRVWKIDMREELKVGNRSIFSRKMASSLEQVLERDQQAILFLNRRGTATYVFCRDCGYSMKCPRCGIPLTYHQSKQHVLLCHHCGYHRNLPDKCPECKSERIRHYGTGTQRVENEVLKRFPGARTLRWDLETTRKKDAHRFILNQFAARQADILIGTQMLAKGLDLPFVTLVGVILADVGLNLPDYRATERTFQVLTQVAGRAGRSPLGGEVILQSFQPEHYVIRAAAQHDYKEFFQQELEYRRQLAYPPFTKLVRLEYRHPGYENAQEGARKMAERLKNWIITEDRRATKIIGPVPCFFERIAGLYRWQILLKGPDPVTILRGRPLGEWRIAVDPPSLL